MGTFVALAILVLALCGALGWTIAAPKGRGIEGAVYGTLLGVIGLVIAALLKDERPVPHIAGPGWYADPWQPWQWRWWDGRAWTGHTNEPRLTDATTPELRHSR